VVKNLVVVLIPCYDSGVDLLPMFATMIPLSAWLLVRGVDPR
jgi:hypothetical protein